MRAIVQDTYGAPDEVLKVQEITKPVVKEDEGGRWVGNLGTVIKTAAASKFVRQQLGPTIKFPNRADLVS